MAQTETPILLVLRGLRRDADESTADVCARLEAAFALLTVGPHTDAEALAVLLGAGFAYAKSELLRRHVMSRTHTPSAALYADWTVRFAKRMTECVANLADASHVLSVDGTECWARDEALRTVGIQVGDCLSQWRKWRHSYETAVVEDEGESWVRGAMRCLGFARAGDGAVASGLATWCASAGADAKRAYVAFEGAAMRLADASGRPTLQRSDVRSTSDS